MPLLLETQIKLNASGGRTVVVFILETYGGAIIARTVDELPPTVVQKIREGKPVQVVNMV